MKREDPLQLRSVWYGTGLQLSVADAKEISNFRYQQTLEKVEDTGPHSFSAVLEFSVQQDNNETLKTFRNEVLQKTLSVFTDYSYSLEYKEVKLPFSDVVASEVAEFCLVVSEHTRIRCFVLYGFDYHLSHIFLLQESRDSIGLQDSTDKRLALEEYFGSWTGQGVRIQLTRPEHEQVTVQSTVRILWDGEKAIRKTLCLRNPQSGEEMISSQEKREASDFKSQRWLYLRDNSKDTVTSYGNLVNEWMATFSTEMEQNVLLLLPFECFIQAPSYLHADHPYHFEFGCKLSSGRRKRQSRLYSRRGIPSSGMLFVEHLSD